MIDRYIITSRRSQRAWLTSGLSASSISVSLISLVLSCCSAQRQQELPAWVINPPRQCAMGSMRAQKSSELTELGAVTRGRAALSHQLQTQVEGIIRSYIAEGEDLKGQVSEESFITYSAQSTQVALQGTEARETFKGSDPYRTLYALVCIERSQVMNIFADLSFLPMRHRGPLRERAHQAFLELNQLLPEPERP